MKTCETYEIELSSLLDGEALPELAAAAVEHALGCAGCAAFFRAARRLDAAARRLANDTADTVDATAETLWQSIQRRAEESGERGASAVRPAPLRRGLRAAALVALGLGGGYWLSTVGGAAAGSARQEGGAVVAASARGTRDMDERRFVALADELLAADLRYQSAMLGVLKLVPALEGAEIGHDDESRPIVRAVSRENGPRAGLL